MTDWTQSDDVVLITEYLRYEVQTLGDVVVCIDGNGKTRRIPDMTTREGWALDCLDSWLTAKPGRYVKIYQHTTMCRRFVWLCSGGDLQVTIGDGATLREAVARALRAVVGEGIGRSV